MTPATPSQHPAVEVYGRLGGAALLRFMRMLRRTCRFEQVRSSPPSGAVIFSVWHRFVFPYFAGTLEDPPRVALLHPAPYMRPWLDFSRRLNWLPIPGATGQGGRHAAAEMVERLRSGISGYLSPDGPYGPPFQFKRGLFRISRESGCPIVPVRFEVSRAAALPSWDRKCIPLPGAHVRLISGEAVEVRGDEATAARAVEAQMMP